MIYAVTFFEIFARDGFESLILGLGFLWRLGLIALLVDVCGLVRFSHGVGIGLEVQ